MFVYTSHDVITVIMLALAVLALLVGGVSYVIVRLTNRLVSLILRMRPWAGR